MRGLIPAHAGKTGWGATFAIFAWAHPRSRGENPCAVAARLRMQGSSPLTRGKPHRGVPGRAGTGLIPAHAGKTGDVPSHCEVRRAHPRSRGENTPEDRARLRIQGSSPLTRGKHPDDGADGRRVGLIPAHAGKTGPHARSPRRRRAHPRSRGENFVFPRQPWPVVGSSPLTRGKRGLAPDARACRRLIPAHAGKTSQ